MRPAVQRATVSCPAADREVKAWVSNMLQKTAAFLAFYQKRTGKIPFREQRDLLVKAKAAKTAVKSLGAAAAAKVGMTM